MNVLVDTCVWSSVLRRSSIGDLNDELESLVSAGRVQIIGPIRQEILSGVRDERRFELIRSTMAMYRDLPLATEDYVLAAQYANLCRSNGVASSAVDVLICAVAARREFSIFTVDHDFDRFARYLPLKMHRPGD